MSNLDKRTHALTCWLGLAVGGWCGSLVSPRYVVAVAAALALWELAQIWWGRRSTS